MAGDERRPPCRSGWSGPQVLDSRSNLYPTPAAAMGWDVGATGSKIVLGAEVPDLVEQHLGRTSAASSTTTT
jgi:alkylresorcinol/alkylpyrone synthase